MSVWNKVLFGLIILVLIGDVYFAALELNLRRHYRSQIKENGEKLDKTKANIEKLQRGAKPEALLHEKSTAELGMDELRVKLAAMLDSRQRAWFGCQLTDVKPDGFLVKPTIEEGGDQRDIAYATVTVISDEDKMDTAGTVYLFSEGNEQIQPAFLGVFNAADSQVSGNGTKTLLAASIPMNDDEIKKLESCQTEKIPVAVYTTMPFDKQFDFFNTADPEKQRILYDNLSQEQYDAAIPEAKREVFKKEDRERQSFNVIMQNYYKVREDLQNDIAVLNSGIAKLEKSIELSEGDKKSLEAEMAMEKKRIEAMKEQRDAVKKISEAMDAQIEGLKEKIENTQQNNEWYVSRIAEYQLKVTKLIEDKEPPAIE
ncbi:MAG: hypothetical protein LBU65_07705 [Planctomycetaceae bacterium]|jgi:hypothetical protein|nr:hypothetical protein [Planctomycetaceae bacterium]